MSELNDFKLSITEEAVSGKLVSNLPNRPRDAGMTAAEVKAYLDYIPITVLGLTKLNGLLTFLSASGGDDIGITAIDGITATKVRTAIAELLTAITAIKGEGWTNENAKTNADAISTIKGEGWTDETLKGLADIIDTLKGDAWTDENLTELATDLTALTTALNTHKSSTDHDDRYYTEAELEASSGASYIGASVAGLDETTVQTVLAKLKQLIDGIHEFTPKGRVDSVELLPTTNNESGDFYLVGLVGAEDYKEYIWLELSGVGHWEYIGLMTNGTIATLTDSINAMKGSGWTADITLKALSDLIVAIKGANYTNETIKGNAENIATNASNIATNTSSISSIAGVGRTTETIKGNADNIATLQSSKLDSNKITSGTTDLTAGTSELATGVLYFVYE